MAEIEIIEEAPLSLMDVKDSLELISKRDKTLPTKGTKVLEYISKVVNTKSKEALEIRKKLKESGIDRLKEKHIAKLIDIEPKDLDSLKAIFTGDNLTLKQEDLKKILECLK